MQSQPLAVWSEKVYGVTCSHTHTIHIISLQLQFTHDVSLSKTICLAQRNEHKTNSTEENNNKIALTHWNYCVCVWIFIIDFFSPKPFDQNCLWIGSKRNQQQNTATKAQKHSANIRQQIVNIFEQKSTMVFILYVGFHSSAVELYGSAVGTCELKCVNECLFLFLSNAVCLLLIVRPFHVINNKKASFCK